MVFSFSVSQRKEEEKEVKIQGGQAPAAGEWQEGGGKNGEDQKTGHNAGISHVR